MMIKHLKIALLALVAVAMSPFCFAETTEIIDMHTTGSPFSAGDTAWVLVSTAFVLLMTIPGLALFYSGMVRKKNILGTMIQSYAAVAVVSLVWVVLGYSLAFSEGSFNGFIGGLDNFMLHQVSVDALSGSIPESLFVIFQMTFAIITVAILAGSFAERMKFSAFLTFCAVWIVVVYAPICHWIWGGGWLSADGALDFAGGTVVHINAGIAGFVVAHVIGRRVGLGRDSMAPHNLSLTLIGVGLLWVGWFGFNAGSALAANGSAAMAMLVTQVAAAAGALAWFAIEHMVRGKASVLGGASGAVAGLVGITPAAGFVTIGGALAIGVLTALVCFFAVTYLKHLLKVDDSLDAFGLHGIGGIVGAVLTGVFVSPAITGSPLEVSMLTQVWRQLEGVLATMVYSAAVTFVLVKLIDVTMGLRLDSDDEREGLDLAVHGERIE